MDYITTSQASEIVGLDESNIRYLMRKGKVAGIKMGRDWLIDPASLTAYANTQGRPGARGKKTEKKETK
jgi:excisionase family DNA binding protein